MKICIVGAAGQVGRGLLRYLKGQPGVSVHGITRNAMSAGPLLAEGQDIRVGDLKDDLLANELLRGADLIVNCALEIDRPKRARFRNQGLISSLIKNGRGLIIHLSSVAVYGSCVDASFSTFERPRPDSTYGREKLRLEDFARRVAEGHGRALATLRLGHVYGPGQAVSREAFESLSEGRRGLPFDGKLASNAIHINCLAEALIALGQQRNLPPILNAFDVPQTTWGDVYKMHAQAAGLPMAGSIPEADSIRLRDEFRRASRLSLPRRAYAQIGAWGRQLPLKSLVNVTAVRQTVEALLLSLPEQVESWVDRRYAVFSAGQTLDGSWTSDALDVPPPWYFSDCIGGPTIPKSRESPDAREFRVQALSDWRKQWTFPVWRLEGTHGTV